MFSHFVAWLRALRRIAFLGAFCVASPGHSQTPPQRVLKETLRIDGAAELLTSAGFLYVARSGALILPSQKDNQLFLFSPTGARRGNFGREGKGPGEFQFSVGSDFGWIGDTLWIYDSGLERITFMSDAGKLLRTQPWATYTGESATNGKYPSGAKVGSMRPAAMLGTGEMIVSGQFDISNGASDSVVTENRTLVLKTGGRAGPMILRFPATRFQVSADISGWTFGARAPFQPRTVSRSAPRGAYHVLANSREVDGSVVIDVALYSTAGQPLYKKQISIAGVPIPKAVLDSAITVALLKPATNDKRAANTRPAIGSIRSALDPEVRKQVPRNFPALASAIVSDDGTVWLKVLSAVNQYQWRSLNRSGQPTAVVTIPSDGYLLHSAGDTLWVSEKDADDVPSLVRYVLAPLRN